MSWFGIPRKTFDAQFAASSARGTFGASCVLVGDDGRTDGTMANRMVREGLVPEGRMARVSGNDRLAMRAIWFPHGIVRDAVVLSRHEAWCMGANAGQCRSVVEEFRQLEEMY